MPVWPPKSPTPVVRADIELLRAAAFAESSVNSIDEASVTDAVRVAVYGRLVALYQPVAGKHYRAVAKSFDDLADRFTAAAKIVNPEASSDEVLCAAGGARAAWFTAAEVAGQLDALLPVLCAAAELAGAPSGIARLVEESDGLRLALVCDPKRTHVRRTWEAFNTTGGRCGRWAALRRLDIAIRAHGNPAKLEAYAQPKPYEIRWEQGKFGGYDRRVVDLNDDPKAAVAAADGWE